MENGRHGILIAIEGIDGAGKSTLARSLGERLSAAGLDVLLTREPTDGPWGKRLRSSAATGRLSPTDELHAFVEDRREHVQQQLTPALAAGQVVIVDRYYFSSAAYQGARGLDPEEICRVNERFAPVPDLLVLVDVDPSVGVARIHGRGDREDLFEREEELRRTAAIFLSLQRPYLLRLDGARPVTELTEAILERLRQGPLAGKI